MKCPFCESLDLLVLDSRHNFKKNIVRRRRSCNLCKERFITQEEIIITKIRTRSNDPKPPKNKRLLNKT